MRTAEFDREQVLRAAIHAFVSKGYTKTSMQDLKAATGLHPGSLYCAFDNKQGLMLAAIEQYDKDKSAEFQALFADSNTVMEGLWDYLARTIEDITSSGEHRLKACLSQKALSELGDNEPEIEAALKASSQRWKAALVRVFEQAIEQGEVSAERSAEQRGQYLAMGLLGLRTYAQSEPDPQLLTELARQLFDSVRG
ncbi:TetR/AcrR family transcriptional regulator [Ferrimonas balearica]|uniref:TetR/AcrR family transcriptional regulator n=1 Tax=Ferrimonas balearica TaxID=44012 RepID=UPI001C998D0C|nr:TetR/AcrR family transcriptional regulator [Ferrimonas balearica]MBY5990911.1 TetR/AcrR family transcriptional regulator [Ferrimonas balearica]